MEHIITESMDLTTRRIVRDVLKLLGVVRKVLGTYLQI